VIYDHRVVQTYRFRIWLGPQREPTKESISGPRKEELDQ